jgi:endonuclease/exonuclease/phosphatase family metal-dependent hydrolase
VKGEPGVNHSIGEDDGTFRVISANLLDGGVGADGGAARREQSAAALREWRPHVVLLQELCAPGEEQVRRNFRTLANATGMEPVALGLPRGSKRLRTAILADTSVAEVLDDGPPPGHDAPFWAEAVIKIRATATVLAIASVHAPATTAAGQLAEAQRLATRTAQRGTPAVTGGDWNCYTPADGLTDDEIAVLPLHLRPSRTRVAGGRLTANYDVHDTLTSVGLSDPVPALPPGRREPPCPPGTGSHPKARIDRFYTWPGAELLPAVRCYHQKPNPGSDHQMIMLCLDPATVAIARHPGPQS